MVSRYGVLQPILVIFVPFIVLYELIRLLIGFSPFSYYQFQYNSLQFLTKFFTTNWSGAAFDPEWSLPFIQNSFYDLNAIVILSLGISRLVMIPVNIGRINDLSKSKYLIFLLNSKLISILLLLVCYLYLFGNSAQNLVAIVYDGFKHRNYVQSPSFLATILITSIFSIIQAFTFALQLRQPTSNTSNEVLYPGQDNRAEELSIISELTENQLVLAAMRYSLPYMLIAYLFASMMFNTPNTMRLFQSVYVFPSIDYFFYNLLLFSFLYLFLYLEIILLQKVTGQLELKLHTPHSETYDRYKILSILSSIWLVLLLFGILFGFTFSVVSSTTFSQKVGVFYNPYYVDVVNSDLPVFSDDHIFGTDYLGRDLFSRLVAATGFYFPFILIGLTLRLTFTYIIANFYNDNPILRSVFEKLSRMPKLLVLYPLGFLLISGLPTIWFILITTIFFLPHTFDKIRSDPRFIRNNTLMLQNNYSRLILIIIFNCLFEAILVDFLFLQFTSSITYGGILISHMSNFPTRRPMQTLIIFSYPIILLSSFYVKLRSIV